MSEHRRLLKSASIITLCTLISRICGYIRDSRIAFLLGAGASADAFTAAYRISNLLRRLVSEGAATAAFIPVFSRYFTDGKDGENNEAWEFANSVLTVLTVVLTAITVIGILASPLVVRLFASGFDQTPGKLELTAMLNRVMFPYIFLISLSALAMGILNSFHRFAAPALAPVVLNLSVIAFSFFTRFFSNPSIALAVGVVVGGVLQIAIQVPALAAAGWRPKLRLRAGAFAASFAHPGVRRVVKLMGPVAFGIGIVQINVLVDTQFASYLREGSVMALGLADRVMELVIGGYTVAISTAILPLLSRQAAEHKIDDLKGTLNFATRMIFFITIPSTVGLVILRRPIVEVLFQHGQFDAVSTTMTAWPLLFFALGLSAFSMVKVIVPAFYALHDTTTPARVALGALVLNIALNFALIGPLQNGGPALATTIAAYFNAVALVVVFHRRYGEFGLRSILDSLGKSIVASLALGVAAFWMIRVPGFYNGALIGKASALAGTIAVSTGTYFAMARLLRLPEAREFRRVARSRIGAPLE